MPDKITELKTLREKIAEEVKLDPSKVDNDEALVNAWSEWVSNVEKQVAEAREAGANDPEHIKAIEERVIADCDIKQAAAEILARADERRKARNESASQDINRKGLDNLAEAERAKADILKRVGEVQTKAFSGVTALALNDTQSIGALLRRPVGSDDPIKYLQRAYDDMLFMRDALQVGNSNAKYTSMEQLSMYPRWREVWGDLTKAFSTGDAAAWTPTYYSADMVENVYQQTNVAGLFPRFDWPGPGSTATIPVEGDDISMFGAGEATTNDEDPPYRASDPTVGTSIVVTAHAFAARTVWSYEMEEDSIINYMEHARMKFVRCFARELDSALLDGDCDGTHQDTGLAASADDHRRLFDGLRKKALADSPLSGITYFNAEQVMTPLLNMGAYGQPATSSELPASGTVGISSWGTRLKLGFLRDTKDQRVGGANAPLTAGISDLFGYPIYGSAKVRSDLTSAGIYDASSTSYTYLLWVFVPAWRIYTKADLSMQIVDRPERGQRLMVGRQRLAFPHVYPSSATTTRMLYYFADTSFT